MLSPHYYYSHTVAIYFQNYQSAQMPFTYKIIHKYAYWQLCIKANCAALHGDKYSLMEAEGFSHQ